MASIQSNSNSEQGHPTDGDHTGSPNFQSLWDYLAYAVATGFGVGLIPFAPGTFGSILGVGLWILIVNFVSSQLMTIFIVVSLVLISVPICTLSSKVIGKTDPGAVVLDEIVAVLIVYALTAQLLTPLNSQSLLLGLILFRLFDVAKPWPIRNVERLPAGWGIVADDIVAALYAAACLTGIMFISRSMT